MRSLAGSGKRADEALELFGIRLRRRCAMDKGRIEHGSGKLEEFEGNSGFFMGA